MKLSNVVSQHTISVQEIGNVWICQISKRSQSIKIWHILKYLRCHLSSENHYKNWITSLSARSISSAKSSSMHFKSPISTAKIFSPEFIAS